MKKTLLLVISMLSSGNAFASVCDDYYDGENSNEVYYAPNIDTKVIGTDRLYFYSAPLNQCKVSNDLFIIPKDNVVIYKEYEGFVYIGYYSQRDKDLVAGWVDKRGLQFFQNKKGFSSQYTEKIIIDNNANILLDGDIQRFLSLGEKGLVYQSTKINNQNFSLLITENANNYRVLYLFKNNAESPILVLKNENIIPCRSCGSRLDDPVLLENIGFDGNKLKMIFHHGGLRERVSELYEFTYNEKKDRWDNTEAEKIIYRENTVSGYLEKTVINNINKYGNELNTFGR